MNARGLASLCWLCAVLFMGCDAGTEPPPAQVPFVFRLTVKNQGGHPVPRLRVSVYPSVDVGSLPRFPAGQSVRGVTASSTVNFGVATPARVSLSLNDLDGSPIQTALENRLLNAGVYAYTLSLHRSDGARVMVCRFVAADSGTGAVVFRDSMYVTLWQPDYQIATAGYTSEGGIFESRDSLSFPYILSLPPIIVTRNDPTPLGAFTFPDSCTITVVDTASAARMTFVRHLVRGSNDISVTWNPTASPGPVSWKGLSSGVPPSLLEPVNRNVFEWRLYQNYPNPFN